MGRGQFSEEVIFNLRTKAYEVESCIKWVKRCSFARIQVVLCFTVMTHSGTLILLSPWFNVVFGKVSLEPRLQQMEIAENSPEP